MGKNLKVWFFRTLISSCIIIIVIIITYHFDTFGLRRSTGRNLLGFLSDNVLTFQCSSGQLGNMMFFYAVVYGLSRLNNRIGYIQECNVKACVDKWETCSVAESLDKIFNLALSVRPDLPERQKRGHDIKFHISYPEDYNIPDKVNILVGEKYPVSVTYFLHVSEEIRQEFTFQIEYRNYAYIYLTRAKGSLKDVTFVGVHVRRKDYISHLSNSKKKSAPLDFYIYAMKYFRRILKNVVFVVLSDDMDWCRKNLIAQDIYIPVNTSSPAYDLAVLSSCQHSIFDYGTYGFWGAFLAGGITLFYVDGIVDNSENDTVLAQKMYPPEWIGVSSEMLSLMM